MFAKEYGWTLEEIRECDIDELMALFDIIKDRQSGSQPKTWLDRQKAAYERWKLRKGMIH